MQERGESDGGEAAFSLSLSLRDGSTAPAGTCAAETAEIPLLFSMSECFISFSGGLFLFLVLLLLVLFQDVYFLIGVIRSISLFVS